MTIWTVKEKPPVLDKFCHLSLDAQRVMASLYRDFHQRKAEILASGCNSSTSFQGTRCHDTSVSKEYPEGSGQDIERSLYVSHTESSSQDKSTYSDSPPVETQDFRLLSQFRREETAAVSPCASYFEARKQNSTSDENRIYMQSHVGSKYAEHTNSRGGKSANCKHTSTVSYEPTGTTNSYGEGPNVYEAMNFIADSSLNANAIVTGTVNDEQGCVRSTNVLQFVHYNRDQSDIICDASQVLFSQDSHITINSNKAEAVGKTNVTSSSRINADCNNDIKLRGENLNSSMENFIFNPVILPVNSVSENMPHDVQVNKDMNEGFERSRNVKRRKTESRPSTKSMDGVLHKPNACKKVSNIKSRDIREFMHVIYPDVVYNRNCAGVSDMLTGVTDESPFGNDVNSAATDSSAAHVNYAEESPFPVHHTHNGSSNIRKNDDKLKIGKKLDPKTAKFRVPVKSNISNQPSNANIVDISKLSTDILEEILATVLEASEVVITLVYRDGSTQLRDCLFGTDKRKCLGKLKKYTEVDSVALQNQGTIYLFPLTIPYSVNCQTLRNFFHVLLRKSEIRKVGFRVKDILITLRTFLEMDQLSVDLSWTVLDSGIAAWLLDPDHPVSSLEQLLSGLGLPQQSPSESSINALPEDMSMLSTVMKKLFQELQREDLWTLYLCLETPLVNVITGMELRSLTVSTHTLLQFSTLLKRNLTRLDQKAHNAAGHAFVLNSHHQLRQVLFEELRLDAMIPGKTKLAKTSVTKEMSTSEAVLTQLSPLHPLPGIVLEYRHLQKLKSAYVDGMLSCVVDDHLVTHWDQTSAATGRLTSYQPNIQAIPKVPITISNCRENFIIGSGKPGEESIEIYARDAFIARSNYSFVAADFQQIELRLLGHLANDPVLLELFNDTQTPDIFNALTSQWLGKPINEIRESEREQTKRVVYSVMYGVGKEKLSQYLKCKPDDAKAIMNSFLLKFPAVSQFTKSCVEFCQQKGYTTSIFKRRRLFPNINDRNPMVRAQAVRQCVNFCVQGSAADICKAAMLQVQKTLSENTDIDASLIVQIHDEILLEVADADLNKVTALVKSVMENREKLCGTVVQLRVPIPVSVSVGKTWGHMEPWIPIN